MATVSKRSLHSPWRKTFIIPLWTCQLGLALAQFSWNLFGFILGIHSGTDSGMDDYSKACCAIAAIFGLIISIVIITSITKFARFKLTSLDFQRENSIAVALGGISTILLFTSDNPFGGILVALQLFFAIWLLVYSILVRHRILRGQTLEMARPVDFMDSKAAHASFELMTRRKDSTSKV